MGNIYSGSIEVERRLTANMPSKLPGNRWVVSKDANDSTECYLHIVDQKGDLLPVKDKTTATLVNNIINAGYLSPLTLPSGYDLDYIVNTSIHQYNDWGNYLHSPMLQDGIYRVGTLVAIKGLQQSITQIIIPSFSTSVTNSRDIVVRYRYADTSTIPYTYYWTNWMISPIEEKGSLSLINGWTNYGNGRSDFGYVRHGNQVFLRGVIKGGSNNIFATLPSNLIPSKAQILYCHSTSNSNVNSTRFDVWTNGDVSISVYDTTNAISLDGASYTI